MFPPLLTSLPPPPPPPLSLSCSSSCNTLFYYPPLAYFHSIYLQFILSVFLHCFTNFPRFIVVCLKMRLSSFYFFFSDSSIPFYLHMIFPFRFIPPFTSSLHISPFTSFLLIPPCKSSLYFTSTNIPSSSSCLNILFPFSLAYLHMSSFNLSPILLSSTSSYTLVCLHSCFH